MDVQAWIAALDKARDWKRQWREVEALLTRGDRATLVEIARVCTGANVNQVGRQSVAERIVETLAFAPGRENVQALAQIYAALPASMDPRRPRLWGAKRARYLASLMACAQAPGDLLELSEWARGDAERQELLACLVGELVVRERLDEASWGVARDTVRGHPLGKLPLALLPDERDFPALLPQYAVGRSSRSYAPTPGKVVAGEGESREVAPIPADEARLQSALVNWRDESNGMLAAGVWSWDAPLAADEFGPLLLRSLNCEATSEIKKLRRIESRAALNTLFSAANAGGAYNYGEYGAWGRLLAWRSSAALVGCDEDARLEIVGEAAARCAWFDFAGESAWFYGIMGDVGLVCLRADGKSVAVLAGTDTD